MDWQTLINLAAGAALSVVGWVARTLWDAEAELKDDLSDLREKLPETYVAKDDFREFTRTVEIKLDRVLDKIDGKADKGH